MDTPIVTSLPTKTQEIERRWVVQSFDPDVLRQQYARSIRQGYIDKDLRVRLTRTFWEGEVEDEFAELTRKDGRGLVRSEVTVSLSPAAADFLLESTKYVIEKTRYTVGRWELDVFHGKLSGLVVLEYEANSVEEARGLTLPSFIHAATEVTEALTNRQLAKAAYFLDESPLEPVRDLVTRSMPARIVLTGAPCSGKSSALRELRNEPSLHTVPETATILMGQIQVMPSIGRMNFQNTIRKVQTSFEEAALKQASLDKKKAVVYDRGTLDAAAFIGGKEAYEALFRTGENEDFSRYDAVVMLALPPREVYEREKTNNPVRRETYEEALAVQDALRTIWGGHPRFIYLEENASWEAKLERILSTIYRLAGA